MLAARLVIVNDRAARRNVDLQASLRSEGAPLDILICNLSVGGFRATLDDDLAMGSHVIVGTACLGVREARVVWRDGDQYGFEFAQPLRPSDVDDARAIDNVIVMTELSEAEPVSPPFPDPVIEKWPRAARLFILLTGAAFLWALIVAIAQRLA